MRILLLEDDRQLGPWVAGGLREEGHVVDHFDNGKEALLAAMGQDFDLLILDRMVPDLDGLAVLKSLRAITDSCGGLAVQVSAFALQVSVSLRIERLVAEAIGVAFGFFFLLLGIAGLIWGLRTPSEP